jgi:hypothetical protein
MADPFTPVERDGRVRAGGPDMKGGVAAMIWPRRPPGGDSRLDGSSSQSSTSIFASVPMRS